MFNIDMGAFINKSNSLSNITLWFVAKEYPGFSGKSQKLSEQERGSIVIKMYPSSYP
jgi:hypothetical protein